MNDFDVMIYKANLELDNWSTSHLDIGGYKYSQ